MNTKVSVATALIAILIAKSGFAQPQRRTAAAFDKYVAEAEARIVGERSSVETFMAVNSLPGGNKAEAQARVRRGEIVIEKRGNTPTEVPAGLIHDWTGTVFIPGATVTQVLGVVRDYDHLTRYYSPDVMQSRLLSHHAGSTAEPVLDRQSDDDFHVFMRLRKHKVITVVLDSEFDVHYGRIDAAHQYSFSRSTRVTEIADPGGPSENPVPEGHDHGFMWRLNTYWAFEQVADGVLVQCEAISLTREIPTGLGWLIGPFVHSIPRESLRFTLTATREAVAAQTKGER